MRRALYFTEVMDDRAHDLRVVLGILRDVGANHALIGGLAVGYHGRPRATIDVDMLVPGRYLKRIAEAATKHGYVVATSSDMIRVYPPGGDESIADVVSIDSNPVLRAAFRETEAAEMLGEQVRIVNRAALVALKFHAATSATREIDDKRQDVVDIGRIIKKQFDAKDEQTARRIASLAYPDAGADFDVLIDDLRHGRSIRI